MVGAVWKLVEKCNFWNFYRLPGESAQFIAKHSSSKTDGKTGGNEGRAEACCTKQNNRAWRCCNPRASSSQTHTFLHQAMSFQFLPTLNWSMSRAAWWLVVHMLTWCMAITMAQHNYTITACIHVYAITEFSSSWFSVAHFRGERNFHIFYYLYAGLAEGGLLQRYHLRTPIQHRWAMCHFIASSGRSPRGSTDDC